MAINGSEVRVAGAGHVYLAPAGTVAPTGLGTLDPKWIDMGYVTEDGVQFSFGRETDDINAWQGTKVRVVTTREPASVTFALMQTDANTLKAAFGGGEVTSTGTGSDTVYKFTPPASGVNTEHALIVEFNDGTITYRYFVARVELEGNVDFTLQRSGAVTYPLTFGALDNGDNPKFIILSNDAAMAPAATAAAAAGTAK